LIFSEAWLNSLVPANIVSGFKICGVYPFNLKAILDHDPCEASHSSGRDLQTSGPSSSIGDSSYTPDEFTAEEEQENIYEEGFDLPDPRYLARLKVNHPTEPYTFVCVLPAF